MIITKQNSVFFFNSERLIMINYLKKREKTMGSTLHKYQNNAERNCGHVFSCARITRPFTLVRFQ